MSFQCYDLQDNGLSEPPVPLHRQLQTISQMAGDLERLWPPSSISNSQQAATHGDGCNPQDPHCPLAGPHGCHGVQGIPAWPLARLAVREGGQSRASILASAACNLSSHSMSQQEAKAPHPRRQLSIISARRGLGSRGILGKKGSSRDSVLRGSKFQEMMLDMGSTTPSNLLKAGQVLVQNMSSRSRPKPTGYLTYCVQQRHSLLRTHLCSNAPKHGWLAVRTTRNSALAVSAACVAKRRPFIPRQFRNKLCASSRRFRWLQGCLIGPTPATLHSPRRLPRSSQRRLRLTLPIRGLPSRTEVRRRTEHLPLLPQIIINLLRRPRIVPRRRGDSSHRQHGSDHDALYVHAVSFSFLNPVLLSLVL
ncbi:hypothetical protein N658DRAFT_32660 [Parathielavia hyrcaniae]|uniref:Uncharacterized protein n=1 Tax=Parathielavia hyrcaniae TaxID=113614 RepID=A0AAN6QEQ6_9PEZI|nr:hypothetical protein N658DRAFT_32660 [Parathielavia hyrcaniae]